MLSSPFALARMHVRSAFKDNCQQKPAFAILLIENQSAREIHFCLNRDGLKSFQQGSNNSQLLWTEL